MVLSVGIISACIISKKRKGALTRLQKLSKKLKQKPLTKKTLYSYPIKNIFQIIVIIVFIGGLNLWCNQYETELNSHIQTLNIESGEKDTDSYVFEHQQSFIFKNSVLNSKKADPFLLNLEASNQIQFHPTLELQKQFQTVKLTVRAIMYAFLIPLLFLMKQTNFERIVIKKRVSTDISRNETSEVVGYIQLERYCLYKWNIRKTIQFDKDDQIRIQLCGQNRFTQKNQYYAVNKLAKKVNREQEEQLFSKEENIVKRGNVFEARTTVIYACHVLGLQTNLDIKNGPIRKKGKLKGNMSLNG